MSVYNELVTVNDLNNVSQIFTELKKMNKNAMMDSEKLHNLFMVRYGDRNVNPSIINLTAGISAGAHVNELSWLIGNHFISLCSVKVGTSWFN